MQLEVTLASSSDAVLLAYDSSLADVDTLLQGVPAGVRLLAIAPEQSAFAAISAALAHAHADTLVLLSHGQAGRVQLGCEALTEASVQANSAVLARWGVQTIGLYACHTGQDGNLAAALTSCTGARVLSSSTAVGHPCLGADWSIDAPANGISLFSRAAKAAWMGRLAVGDPLTITDGTVAINTLADYNENNAVTVTAPITVEQANALDLLTTGVIIATISDGAMALLNGLTGSGNAYTIVVTDASVDADAFNTLNGKTTVALGGTAITTLTGSATAVLSALNAVGTTVSGLSNPAVTLSDTSLATATLNQLDAATTGVVDATSVTTLTGNAADLLVSFAANNTPDGITGLGSQAITLADSTLAAVSLNQLDAATTGVVNAANVTTLTGNAAALLASFAAGVAGTIAGLGSQAVTLADSTLAAASLNQLDAATTGVVDATSVTTLTGNAADLLVSFAAGVAGTIAGLGSQAVTLSDSSLATATLTQLDTYTSGTVNAGSVATIVGTFADLNTFFSGLPAGFSGIDGSENLSVTGPISVNEANALDLLTTGVITATISDGAMAALNTLSDNSGPLDNAFSITVTDPTVLATELNALDGKTSVPINAAAVTSISGSAVDVIASYTANALGSITGLGDEAITLNDTSLSGAALNLVNAGTTGVVNAASVTTLTGNAADLLASFAAGRNGSISGLGTAAIGLTPAVPASQAVTVSDTTLAASSLNQLNADTNGVVNAASVTTLTGNAADLLASFAANAAGTINGLGNEAITLADSTLAAASLNQLDAATTGVVNAASVTTLTGNAADLLASFAANAAGTINGLGNEAITLADSTLAAASLNQLDAATTGVVNAASVTTLTGNAADLLASFAANAAGTINGLGNEAITLADTTLAAVSLNQLDAATTGVVNAASVTTLTGNAADLLVSFAAGRNGSISGLGTAAIGLTPAVPASQAVTVSDTTLAASSLNQLNADTNGVVNAASVTTLTGNAADLLVSFAAGVAGTIAGLGSQAVTLADSTLAAASLNQLDAATTGVVNAASVTTLTGNAVDLLVSFNAGLAGTITGLGTAATLISPAAPAAQAVTVNDVDLAATSLNQLDALTNGLVNAAAVGTLRGLANDVLASYGAAIAGRVIGLGNEAVVLSDTSLTATALNQVDASTNGLVDAATVLTLSGAANEVLASYAAGVAGSILGLGTEAVVLNNTNLAAAILNQVNAATTGVVNASSITTLTGTAADLIASYAAGLAGGISGLGNEALTLSDTVLTAAVLNQLDLATTGVVDAASLTSLSGTAAELLASYAAAAGLTPSILGLGNETIILSGVLSLDAAILNQLDAVTTGPVDAGSVLTITGTAADVVTAYQSTGITGLGNEAVTLSDGQITAAALNQVVASTSGLVNASAINTITGRASEVLASYAAGGTRISGLGNEAINITDTSIDAVTLNQLNALTNGLVTAVVDASSVTTINGLAQDVLTAYAASVGENPGIIGLGDEAVGLSNSDLGAAILNAVDTATSGVVDASGILTLTGNTTDLLTSYAAATGVAPAITGLGDEAVTIDGPTVNNPSLSAAALNQVDAATTGVVNASNATSISGTVGDVFNAFIANATGTITGLGNKDVNLDGVISIANANIADAFTTGAVGATIQEQIIASLTTLTGIDNAYRITISDTTGTAADLNLINTKSTVAIDAQAITTVTGLTEEIQALETARTNGEILFSENVDFISTDASQIIGPAVIFGETFGEYGTLQPLSNLVQGALSSSDWSTVSFSRSYISPVVIISDPTFNGPQPVVVRMQNLTGDGFQYALQEYNYLDGAHVAETLSYMVMEAGTYTLADGSSFTAGTVDTNLLSSQGFADLGPQTAGATTLLTQVQTFNGPDAVVTRTRVDGLTGNYQVAMQEQQSLNGGAHMTETIGYVAFTTANANGTAISTSSVGDVLIEGGLSQGISHTGGTVGFDQNFSNAPTLLTKVSTFNGADTANSRVTNVTADGFSAFVQEEQSFDAEMLHVPEQIGFLAFDGISGTLTGTSTPLIAPGTQPILG